MLRRCSNAVVLFLAVPLAGLASCERPADRIKATAALAASPTGGRAAAAAQLTSLMAAGKVTTDRLIDTAWDMVDAATAKDDAKASVEATVFAGAVLDAIAARESFLFTGGEYEFFWMKVGGLAFKSAEEAHAEGRYAEAATLVFAGGQRWQHDAYWNRQSHHDAVAALILAKTGRRSEAIQRLESRAELKPPADEVLAAIKAAK
jgi:hypothetical protein